MQSSRGTPTPSSSRVGRPLTHEVIQQYRQLFEAAQLHRPVSPTLPPSPPASSSAETGPSPASSESSGKRKREETSSAEAVSPPTKRSRHQEYRVPARTRHGPPSIARTQIAGTHMERATGFKRRGDKDQSVMQSAAGANLYALSMLNYAFAYRLEPHFQWKSLGIIMNVTFDRFGKLSRKEPSPKLDAWMSYLQLFKSAVELQQDEDALRTLRKQIDVQMEDQHKRAQKAVESSQSQTESTLSEGTPTKGPSADVATVPSQPGTPLPQAPAIVSKLDGQFSLNWEEAKALSAVLARARTGTSLDGRRRAFKHLNPTILRTHFPRTFMRAFGEDGFGHVATTPETNSPDTSVEQKGPLNVWEDYEIWDLEENEREGGDFPYPHHPDDILWVIILGRSMLADLGLPESI